MDGRLRQVSVAMLLVDTHAWVWIVAADERKVGRRARQAVVRAEAQEAIRVSVATIFEIAALYTAGRLVLSKSPEHWIRESLARPGVRVAELSMTAAIDAGFIPRAALADPLDRLLVATARDLDATFLTGDGAILDYARETRAVRVQNLAR